MSYTKNLQHITFSTKGRKKVLSNPMRQELFKILGYNLKKLNCKPILINGTADHIHILCNIHPSVAIAHVVKTLKLNSSAFIKYNFPNSGFDYWNEGYGSFSFSHASLQKKYNYVANQEAHHQKTDSRTELEQLLTENGVDYDSQYLT
jgi:putative transposase